MKLIIEKDLDGLYAYRESERHFEEVQPTRINRMEPEILDRECNLEDMPIGHLVFDIVDEDESWIPINQEAVYALKSCSPRPGFNREFCHINREWFYRYVRRN